MSKEYGKLFFSAICPEEDGCWIVSLCKDTSRFPVVSLFIRALQAGGIAEAKQLYVALARRTYVKR
jgi:hypothetical protein